MPILTINTRELDDNAFAGVVISVALDPLSPRPVTDGHAIVYGETLQATTNDNGTATFDLLSSSALQPETDYQITIMWPGGSYDQFVVNMPLSDASLTDILAGEPHSGAVFLAWGSDNLNFE